MDLEKETFVAKKAVREAGRIMEKYRRKSLKVSRKEDQSIVTEADIKCQKKIVELITEEFPDDGFLGEEENLRKDSEERKWIIDPIDGSNNYSHGIPIYCSSIGLKIGGSYELGVVYVPRLDEMYVGKEGKAFLNGERIRVSDVNQYRDAIVFFSPSHGSLDKLKKRESDLTNLLFSKGCSVRDMGSGVYELLQVAVGRAECFVAPDTNEWDFAGPLAVLESAGGTYHVEESRYRDGMYEVVASNNSMHDLFRKDYQETIHRPGLAEN